MVCVKKLYYCVKYHYLILTIAMCWPEQTFNDQLEYFKKKHTSICFSAFCIYKEWLCQYKSVNKASLGKKNMYYFHPQFSDSHHHIIILLQYLPSYQENYIWQLFSIGLGKNFLTGINLTFIKVTWSKPFFFLYFHFTRFSQKVHTEGPPNLVSIFLTSKSMPQSILRSIRP